MMAKAKSSGIDLFLARAKSLPAPFYREFPPAPDLRAFIACTWIRVVRCAGDFTVDAILPDGCGDIMMYDDHAPQVAAPDSVTRHVRLHDGVVITGIRMRPGAWRAVLKCRADALVNGSVLLSDLAADGRDLRHRMLRADRLADRIELLEGWVRAALTTAAPRDRAVVAACRILGARPGATIGAVAAQLGWNARMMHREFTAACGYGAKHLQRIMRLQTLLRTVGGGRNPSLSSLAMAAGYSDQAHMTRDFRAITGFTPASYLATTVSPGWGAWLSEEW